MRDLSEEIERLIAAGGLDVGARLPSERQLASTFGVSRSSLREAIQKLISRGRLVSRHGGGTYVAEPSASTALQDAFTPLKTLVGEWPDYWQDVMEIRKSLEGDAAYYAAERASDEDRARMKMELERVSHRHTPQDAAPLARADVEFHMSIAHASHNAVLIQVMAGLFDLMEQSISHSLEALYRLPSTVDMLEQQHAAIIEAILAGHAAQARTKALEHLEFVERSLRPIEEAAARQRRAFHAFPQSPSQKDA
jgi:GntR family transcriptional regulator, L-lactate dehydrogenase operon regulator